MPQAAGSGESRTRSESGPYIAEPCAPSRNIGRSVGSSRTCGALSSSADSPMRASMRARSAQAEVWAAAEVEVLGVAVDGVDLRVRVQRLIVMG